jgi:hypothetical protein
VFRFFLAVEPKEYLVPLLIAALIFLLVVAGGLGSFLFLLIRYDLSPKIAIGKIKNRFRKTVPTQLPSFRDAPYRRLTEQTPRHHPVLVNLETSEGTGQACHPDVTYIKGGLGTERWRYWMVCTPYPYANFVHENPEIFASHDGIHWTIPDGVKNPLISSPEGRRDYNSDPDMFFLNGELWLYYRETQFKSGLLETRIWLTTSLDGAHWSSSVEVLAARGDEALLMSPAVTHECGAFRMWTVDRATSGLKIMRRDSTDGVRWGPPIPCSLVGLSEREPWHLDVIREEDRLSALLVSVKAGANWRLHYAHSLDEGNTWNVERFLLEPAYEFEEAFQYRATLLKTSSNPAKYRIWYSAANRRQMHSIAHLAMVRRNGNLEPVPEPGNQHDRRPAGESADGEERPMTQMTDEMVP